jgi:multidrug efflux pump subunit AcrA (membrane-fusion protein)
MPVATLRGLAGLVAGSIFILFSFSAAAAFARGNSDVDAALANLKAAQAVAKEAETFRAAVARERARAHTRADAARTAVVLAGRAKRTDPDGLTEARHEQGLADDRADAADAKMQFASDLVALRRQQVDLRQAELDLARARADLERHDWLAEKVPDRSLDREDFVRATRVAEADARQKRTAVETTRSRFDVAARQAGESTPEATAEAAPPRTVD